MANNRSIIIDIGRRANALSKILERVYSEGTGIGTVVVRGLRDFQKFKVLRDEFEAQVKDMAEFHADGAAQSAASKMWQAKGTAKRMERILAVIRGWVEHDVVGKEERRLQRYERLIKDIVEVVDRELIMKLRSDHDRIVRETYADVKACENDLAAIAGDLKVLKKDVPQLVRSLNIIIVRLARVLGAETPPAVEKHSKSIDKEHLRNLETRFEACERVAFRGDQDILKRVVDLKKRVYVLASNAKRIKKSLSKV